MNPNKIEIKRYTVTLQKWSGITYKFETNCPGEAGMKMEAWHGDNHNYFKLELFDHYSKNMLVSVSRYTGVPLISKFKEASDIGILGVSSCVQ